MKVILLERVGRHGTIGDEVNVKAGFARNFLLPQGKALRATDANRSRFEGERQAIEARNAERRSEAEKVASGLEGYKLVVIRQAGETGQLYGSVSSRDVADALAADGQQVERSQVDLVTPIKTVGLHDVLINLHGEVSVTIQVNVARSADEAERQSQGEDLTRRSYDDEDEEEEALLAEGEDEGEIEAGEPEAEDGEVEDEGEGEEPAA